MESRAKKDGKVLVTGIWTLSADGKNLNDHFTSSKPNGETSSVEYVYERRSGGTGFVGDRVSTTEHCSISSSHRVSGSNQLANLSQGQ